MNEEPQITLAIPALNEEATISDLLSCVARQTRQPDEVLVIDGMSDDSTRDIVGQFKELPIRIIDNPERRVPQALNLALRNATGDVLIRVDAHSEINDDYIKTIADRFIDDPSLGGVGGVKIATSQTRRGEIIAKVLSSPLAVGGSKYHYAQGPQIVDHIPFGAYPTSILRRLNGWDETLCVNQDFELDYRIRQGGHKLLLDPEAKIFWKSRDTVPRLFSQYHRYGQGKLSVILKHPRSTKARHLLPGLLVSGLLFSLLAAITTGTTWLLAFPFCYLLAVSLAAKFVDAIALRDWPIATASMIAMQVGYGTGLMRFLLLTISPLKATVSQSQTSTINSR